MINKYHEILGWYGVVGVLADAYFQKNYQPVVLNIFWAGIAVFGILQIVC